MKQLRILLALAFVAALIAVYPATAQPPPKSQLSGGFKMSVHAHSGPLTQPGEGLRFPVQRLPFDFGKGDTFMYSSRPCEAPAAFNDVGLDFRPNFPGVDDDDGTARVRHWVKGEVKDAKGDRGTIVGSIESRLCSPPTPQRDPLVVGGPETGDAIFTSFVTNYRRVSNDEVQLTGQYDITGGLASDKPPSPDSTTGRFIDLTGHGSIQAILTCLGEPTCGGPGGLRVFTDFVALRGDTSKGPGEAIPGLMGTFRDETVPTS